MILDYLIDNINSLLKLTLITGLEKEGRILSVDKKKKELILEEKSTGVSIIIAVSIVAMVEPVIKPPVQQNKEEATEHEKFDLLPLGDKSIIDHSVSNLEVLRYILRIELTFDAESRTASWPIAEPDFNTPEAIRELNFGNPSEEPRDWTFIKNKYDNAKLKGHLSPQSEDLREIIHRCRRLTEHSTLYKKPVFHAYLGYFSYLNDAKEDAVQSLQKAAKLSDHPQDWKNLASIALEMEENELACFSLNRVFQQVNATDPIYEKPWFKFAELSNRFSYFSFFQNIHTGVIYRMMLKDEYKLVFEAICYFLVKRKENALAESLALKALETEDYIGLILEGQQQLPKEPTAGFTLFISNFDRMTVQYVPPEVDKKPAFDSIKKQFYGAKFADADLHRDAVKASQHKDYENADRWFREAIERDINKANAVRDLAMMLDHLKRPQEAVELLERYTDNSIKDKNILSILYYKVKRFEEAIKVKNELYKQLDNNPATDNKTSIIQIKNKKKVLLVEIANCYIGLENYEKAVESFKNALKFDPGDINTRRNIAICYYKDGEIEKAKKELAIIIAEGDNKSTELLEALNNTKSKNDAIDIIISNLLVQYSTDLDGFAQFYLDRCDYKGVPPERIEDGKYVAYNVSDREYDINKLEKAATALGTARPGDRSEFFLSAAKIIYDSKSEDAYLYRYLCKSFTSKADNAVYDKKALDSIKTLYLEAMKVYEAFTEDSKGKDRDMRFDEQDAVNAVYRYLYAQLGHSEIPLGAQRIGSFENQMKQIKDSCDLVFDKMFKTYSSYNNILDAVKLAISRSPQYAGKRLLQTIFENAKLNEISVKYLKEKSQGNYPGESATFEDFAKSWQAVADELSGHEEEIANQVEALRQFTLSDAWLKNAGQRVANLLGKDMPFALDKDYLRSLGDILDDCITYMDSKSFDDRIGRYSDIENKCKKQLDAIEKNPTKLSIEAIHDILEKIKNKLREDIDRFYDTTKPELIFTSAVNPYIIKEEGQTVDIQINIRNEGQGHAEQIELSIKEDPVYFSLSERTPISCGTIRGNDQDTIIVIMKITAKTIEERSFSFMAFCHYKTRRGEEYMQESEQINIQLGSIEDFEEINHNPYAQYASADVVDDKSMFYGREQFIDEAYKIICNNYKSYAISGQKRAGKSSILYHLGLKLRDEKEILVVDVGNIGRLFDTQSKSPLLYQLLYSILKTIKNCLEDHPLYESLEACIPKANEFYDHHTPVDFFYDIILDIKNKMKKISHSSNARIIILIDEFSYIYYLIVGKDIENKIRPEFLMQWKALLEKKLFSAIVVSQDFFDKFIAIQPNAFQMIESKRVSYLEPKDAFLLIDEPIQMKNKKSRYTESAIQRILELTSGSPYYIQIFCNRLVNHVNKEKIITITEANINMVKDELLRGYNRLNKFSFDNLFGDGDPSADAISDYDSEQVLMEIARLTKNQKYCNKNQINCQTEKPLQVILNRLKEREVIEFNSDGYCQIRVGLFKEWLIENRN